LASDAKDANEAKDATRMCVVGTKMDAVCLLQGAQDVANSYVDQQQETKERGDEIERIREDEKSTRLIGKDRKQRHNWHPVLLSSDNLQAELNQPPPR
jgi:hypothetical protein